MKIYQLSSTTCIPCIRARKMIETIDGSSDWWQWVDLAEEEQEPEVAAIIQTLQPRSVPTFVVASTDEEAASVIIHHVEKGFTPFMVRELVKKYIDDDKGEEKELQQGQDKGS